MRFRLRTLLVLFALSWLLAGCRQSATPPVLPEPAAPTPPAAAASESAGPTSYSLEVRNESGGSQMTLPATADVTVGKVRLRVQDGALNINGRSYGKIKSGDAVLIESDGQVLVNLEIREPW